MSHGGTRYSHERFDEPQPIFARNKLVTGDEDRNYPPFLSEALAPMMPNAKVEQVPETGHSVYFQRPEIYNQLVGDFLLRVG